MPGEFTLPALNLRELAPILVILAAACLALPIEAFVPRKFRHASQLALTLVAIVGSLVWAIVNYARDRVAVSGVKAFMVDGPTYFLWWTLLVCAGLSILVFGERILTGHRSAFTPSSVAIPGSVDEREADAAGFEHTEVYPLALFALSGMMMFVAANDLLMLFVALEVMSLPLYVLTGLARRRRLVSQEASLKYFLLGAMSSALFLMGVAMMYGVAGAFDYRSIAAKAGAGQFSMLLAGIALVAIGLLFKVGAVPFHSWTPDVYQGAPTPVTGFMAACTKAAAVGALARFLFVAVGAARWSWQPLIAIIAALTIIVGTLLAIRQTDVKRLLAYSSVAHAGFILAAIVGATTYAAGVPAGQLTSMGSVMFYLAAYGVGTIAAFALVTLVRKGGAEANDMADWAGLAKRQPIVAGLFSMLLLSFAGIPLTSGFVGKLAVFAEAWRGGYWWLVLVGVLMSVAAAYFYTKFIIVMWFTDGEAREDSRPKAGITTWLPIGVGALVTILLGLVPGPVLDLAMRASEFLR